MGDQIEGIGKNKILGLDNGELMDEILAEEKERDEAQSKKVIFIEDDCTLRNLYRTMEFFNDPRATGYVIPTYKKAMDRMGFKDDEEIEKTFEYIIDNYKTMPMPCEIREALEKVREKDKPIQDPPERTL